MPVASAIHRFLRRVRSLMSSRWSCSVMAVTRSVFQDCSRAETRCARVERRFSCSHPSSECGHVISHLLDVLAVGLLQPEDQGLDVHPSWEGLQ